MTCEINLEGLYMMVKKRIDLADGKVDPRSMVNDIYDKIYKGVMSKNNDSNDARNQALAYARMVPTMIRTGLMSDAELFSKSTQTGFDFAGLARMEQEFKKDIKNVAPAIAAPETNVQESAQMQERIEEVKKEKSTEKSAALFNNEINQQLGNSGKYPPTFFATTGVEFVSEPWKYALQRKILRMMRQSGTRIMSPGSTINYPGVGPVKLRLMKVQDLGENQWDRTKNEDGSFSIKYKPVEDDIAYVLVDEAGNKLYFDDTTGELSSEKDGGRVAYWMVYKPSNYIQKGKDTMGFKPFVKGKATTDREKTFKKIYLMVANHLSNSSFATDYKDLHPTAKEIIDNELESQLVFMQAVHDAVLEGKVIDFNIMGGTLGYVTENEYDQKVKTPLRNLPFISEENFQVEVVRVEGNTFSVFQHDGEPIEIKVTPGVIEEHADALVSLLLDKDLVNEKGEEISTEQRMELIERFINTGKTKVDGKRKAFLNNSKITVSRAEGKPFVAIIPKMSNGRFNMNAATVNISDNPMMREMLKEYLMNMEFTRINDKYAKFPNSFSVPYVETLSDGRKVVRMRKMNYHEFIRTNEKFHITAKQDPTGDLLRRDSYFTMAPEEMDYISLMESNPKKTDTEKAEVAVSKKEDVKKKEEKKEEKKKKKKEEPEAKKQPVVQTKMQDMITRVSKSVLDDFDAAFPDLMIITHDFKGYDKEVAEENERRAQENKPLLTLEEKIDDHLPGFEDTENLSKQSLSDKLKSTRPESQEVFAYDSDTGEYLTMDEFYEKYFYPHIVQYAPDVAYEGTVEISFPEPAPESDNIQTKSGFDNFMNSPDTVWDKLKVQKTGNVQATKEQVRKAKEWYESSPLSKHIPFQVMFNAVNSRNPKSVAEWSIDGIILYEGSDYTDLYHEAWHGFSQTFLTPAQRGAMYKELSKKKGSFKDYNGKLVEFSYASEKQLEEYLAEKFREFMLSEGQKVDSQTPKTNNIFKKILNFLRELFGSTSYKDGVSSPRITKTVDELYEKLRIGNISEFSYDANNRGFGVLFSPIMAKDEQSSTRQKLSYQESTLIIESIDSVFSMVMDDLNRSAMANGTKRFSNTLFKSKRNMLNAYNAAYLKLQDIRDNMVLEYNKETDVDKRKELDDKIELLSWTLLNFGDLKSIEANIQLQRGVIYAHIQKSKLLSNEDKEAATSDELEESDTFKKDKGAAWDRSGQDMSLKEMASKEILYIMRGLYQYGKDGSVKKNIFGLPKLADFDKTWNFMARTLEGQLDIDLMYQKLDSLSMSKMNPDDKDLDLSKAMMITQLLSKFGPVSTLDYHGNHLWTNFWQTFNKTRVPLVQMIVSASKDDKFQKINYNITIGEVGASSNQVIKSWENRFATTRTKYIKERQIFLEKEKKIETENYLDLNAVFSNPKYKNWKELSKSANDIHDFLNDIGIVMSYRPEILKAYTKDPAIMQAIRHIHNTLSYLYYDRRDMEAPVRSISDIFAAYEEDGREQAYNRLNDLRDLEAKHGDLVNSFMVSNAEGNPQFEHSLNSTMTVLVAAINKANSFKELYEMPHMAHFNPERNPFVNSSIWLKSIFVEKPGGGFGAKRMVEGQPVKITFENLSGVKTIDEYGNEDGISTASADPLTKFILDFHSSILRGSPELPRHADKGSSYSAYVTNVYTGDMYKSSRFKYIDDSDFLINAAMSDVTDQGFGKSKAFIEMKEILLPYVKSELIRIETMKELAKNKDLNYDFDYLERGQKFNVFDDIFTPELKKKLIKDGSEKYLNHKEEITNALEKYFNNLTDQNLKLQTRASFVDSQVKTLINRQIRNKLSAITGKKVDVRFRGTNEDFKRGLMMSFVVNNWIHNLESLTVFYGDLALYNHKKEEFHKRNAGAASTGDLFRTDRSAIQYARSLGRGFGKKKFGREKAMSFDGTFDSAVFEDTLRKAEFYDQYETVIRKYFNERYKNPEVAKSKADKVLEKYSEKETKEGDAQGWITFDAYRIMLSLQGKWTTDQEDLYQRMLAGENVDTEKALAFFPVKKVQYWGPLQTEDGPPIMAMHKFSLVPLLPNVIQGTNLEKLNDKMIKDDIDYALFKSGSKIGTVGRRSEKDGKLKGVSDAFYSNMKERIFNEDGPELLKNTVFLNFMKDQLDTGDKFKGKITFPTQMRKLLIDGFMEAGVPIDYEPNLSYEERISRWKGLSPSEKKKASPYYTKYRTYEEQVTALTKQKYQDLLKKIDFKEVNGKPVGDVTKLANYIRTQFELQDLSDQEKAFIEVGPDGRLKRDLSLSFSSDKIEKILNAIVVRELVKQKIKGEGLIQVSVAGWEKVGSSSELKSYHIKDGVVQPMEVKIALQGDFFKLLKLPKVKEMVNTNENMTPLQALNILINDEKWLSEGNNRKMVMMTGTRIPVQGTNSMEFMRIKEFLPANAAHMFIAPSEIVSKTGSDFDIDKMFTMMPSIKIEDGSVFYDGAKIENKLIESQIDLLSTKENFVNLIRPNATDIFDDMAADLRTDVTEYDPMENQNPDSERDTISPTRILELPYNLYKQNTNSIGKQVLGIGAVENTYNVLFNRIGMYMNPTSGISFEDYYNLRDHVLKYRMGRMKPGLWYTINGVRKKWSYKEIKKYVDNFGRQVLAMPHNSRIVNGKKVISISNMYDANNEHRISDVISQMINGWVDVAKDTWIFNIQGNKEITPTLLYLIQAGVPVEQAVYFVSQPLVRQYVEKQRENKSIFAGPLGIKPHQANLVNYNAKRDILINQVGVQPITTTERTPTGEVTRTWYDKIDTFDKTVQYVQPYMKDGFDKQIMRDRISDFNDAQKKGETYTPDDFDKAAFLHFLEVEEQAKALTAFKRTTNVDTTKQSTLFEARKKEMAVAELKANGRIPVEMVDRIQDSTVIESFFDVLNWQQSIWGPYFKIRDNEALNDTLTDFFSDPDASDIVNKTFNGDYEKFANEFRNDFMVYLYQQDLYNFDLKNLKSYKGYGAIGDARVQEVDFLKFGVLFKNGVLYIDKKRLETNYMNLSQIIEPAPVKSNMFTKPDQYYHYMVEREFLRSRYPLALLKDTIFFRNRANLNQYKLKDVDDNMKEIITYEETLRDMALDNTFNMKHMFKGRDTMAAKLMTILKEHPELKDNYRVMEVLGIQKIGLTWNIKLEDTMLDSDKIGLYHENMTDLMDPDKININADYADRKIIADFFSKMATFSILQSGLNTNSKLSLQRIVNNDQYLLEAERITHPYTRERNPQKIDKSMMNEFMAMFQRQMSLSNADRVKMKDYVKPLTKYFEESAPMENETEKEFDGRMRRAKYISTDATGKSFYDFTTRVVNKDQNGKEIVTYVHATPEEIEKLVMENPKMLFIYEDTVLPVDSKISNPDLMSFGYNLKMLEGKYPNVIGIPARMKYSPLFSMAAVKDIVVDGVPQVDPGYQKMVDDRMAQIMDKLNDPNNEGMYPVFRKNGYGQRQVNANENYPAEIAQPKTEGQRNFKYLSESLYKNFKYVNPNYAEKVPDATQFIMETQPITDEMVLDQLKFCYFGA